MPPSTKFEETIHNWKAPIAYELNTPSSSLLIAFGGLIGRLNIAPFEFFNLTSSFPTKKMYVRDLKVAWYHLGLPGIGDGIESIAVHLGEIIVQEKVETVVMAGNSMGGYAAMLFGSLLNAQSVHAFSPQTFIDRNTMLKHREWRWLLPLRRVHNNPNRREDLFDLKQVLEKQPSPTTRFHLHYSTKDRLDTVHALRMQGCSGIELHPCNAGGHGLIRHLRNTGALKELLLESLTGSS